MPYRRAYQPGGCYFFNVVTHHRQKLLTPPENIINLSPVGCASHCQLKLLEKMLDKFQQYIEKYDNLVKNKKELKRSIY